MAPPRKFDYDEARRLRAEGAAFREIARRLGVSDIAVRRACDPELARRMDLASQAWNRENMRKPCLGGCGRLVWLMVKGRSGYCPRCWGSLRASPHVRDGELRCTKCGEWKPDDAFATSKGKKARRGHNSWCRSCETAARMANRAANRERERAYDRERRRRAKEAA